MNPILLRRTPVALVLLCLTLLLIQPVYAQTPASTETEILWDVWGVPHIFAPDNEGMFHAFGWAQAHNHADLLLRLYGQARGRAAEYWGADFIESDRVVKLVGLEGESQRAFATLSDEFRGYLTAFADGFNQYALANLDQIADDREQVLPIEPVDVLAHGLRVLRYGFMARPGFSAARRWQNGEIDPLPMDGSNAWAIAPARSASGHAMLVANPHQPWSGEGLWMEAHLVSPEVNLYGAALVGNPILGIAFNPDLGWTHTNNTRDGWDVYQLALTPDGSGYRYDGAVRPFIQRTAEIRVRQPDGRFTTLPLLIKESVHGPVVAERDGLALALRVVGEHAYEAAVEWWEMGKARTFDEFTAAIRNIRIPMFTIMYADRAGNIMHFYNEEKPILPGGDWAFWNNTDPIDNSRPAIIPGDSSRYLWTAFHPFEDLPRLVNPSSGWLQNANEPPWTTTLPLALNPADYPAYMAPPPLIWPRPQQSMRLLYEDESITFDELIAKKQTTFMELTRWVLDDLIAAAAQSDDELVQRSAEVLRNWDRHADPDSVGAVLFTAWAASYLRPAGFEAFATPWDIDDPLNTPRGLADPTAAVEGLKSVAQQLEAIRLLGGGIDVAYGDAFRMRVGAYDLPASGADDVLGTFRTLSFAQDSDLRFRVTQGDSYVAVIEFSDPVRAKVLLSYGNATQPNSPHFGDQLELFARKELRDAWLTRADIEANLAERVVLRR